MLDERFDLDGFLQYIHTRPITVGFRNLFEVEESSGKEVANTRVASILAVFSGFQSKDDHDWCEAFISDEKNLKRLASNILEEVVSWERKGYIVVDGTRIGLTDEYELREFAFEDSILSQIRRHNSINVRLALAVTATANASTVAFIPNQYTEYDFLYRGEEGVFWLGLLNKANKTYNRLPLSSILQMAEDAEKFMPDLSRALSEEESRYTTAFPWYENTEALAHIDGAITADIHPVVGEDAYPFYLQRLSYATTAHATAEKNGQGGCAIKDCEITIDTPTNKLSDTGATSSAMLEE